MDKLYKECKGHHDWEWEAIGGGVNFFLFSSGFCFMLVRFGPYIKSTKANLVLLLLCFLLEPVC